jgi:hypothetical protein
MDKETRCGCGLDSTALDKLPLVGPCECGMNLRVLGYTGRVLAVLKKDSAPLSLLLFMWFNIKPYSNANLRSGMSYVQDVIHQKCNNHHTRLETHGNPLLKTLLIREENRRLKRNWPIDLISGTGDSPLDDSPSRQRNNYNISLHNVNSDCWFKL